MSAFKRGKNQQLYVPLRSGGLVQRSTGTPSIAVRNKLKTILAELRAEGRWTLIEAVSLIPAGKKKPRLAMMQLYAANAAKTLDQLEARFASATLAAHVDAWQAWVVAQRGATGTDANYRQQVDTFLAKYPEATTADLEPAKVTAWLGGLTCSTGTRRKYLYALRSFLNYLRTMGLVKGDPLADVKAPKKNPPRLRWETAENDRRIVEVADVKYRALFAFIKSTSADVGAAIGRAKRRDIDLARGVATLRGTKTDRRQVHEAMIEEWALPYLTEYLSRMLPNATLWPARPKGATAGATGRYVSEGYTRSGAAHHHERCCELVGIEDYSLKDARHSVAVRMRFAGYSFEDIAEQLGNSPYQVATVYARFKPKVERRQAATGGQG
jgi:integrase